MSEPRRPHLSFVVPLYNTGASLPKLLDAFRELSVPGGWELVLVNDASPDGTGAKVPALLPTMPAPVTFVDLARNFGEHAAVLEGLRHARGEIVVNLDDDLQNPISEALKLANHLRETGADVVYSFYEEKRHHWFRNFGSWAVNSIATVLLDKPKDLYLSSFRAMSSGLVSHITRYRGPYPYVDGLILGATSRIERLQVAHEQRAEGQSGYTLRKLLRLGMNMCFNFSVMPLRVASILGALLCVAGLLLCLVLLVEYFTVGISQVGYMSMVTLITIFSGAQLMMLGIIGEYLGRAYLTVSGKPQSLIRSVLQHQP
jgi:undecaprenyl-phosphate 4-deoxy-4-formamido-L-arabinose transferase